MSEYALRLALRQHEHNSDDSDEIYSNLLSAFMQKLGMDSLKQLVVWTLSAQKNEIAELAPIVLDLWKREDEIATTVIDSSLEDLSDDLICLVEKLNFSNRNDKRISIGLTGSLFSKDNEYAETFQLKLKSKLPPQTIVSIKILRNTTLGSLKMLDPVKWKILPDFIPPQNSEIFDLRSEIRLTKERELGQTILPVALGLSLTEKRNERSMNLDTMATNDAIDLMINEEQNIFGKISECKTSLGILIERVCRAFQNGGRLFYVGAGTSGRLGEFFFSFILPQSS